MIPNAITLSSGVAVKPIRNNRVRCCSCIVEEVAEEALGNSQIPSRLYQKVHHEPVLIDGTPSVMNRRIQP